MMSFSCGATLLATGRRQILGSLTSDGSSYPARSGMTGMQGAMRFRLWVRREERGEVGWDEPMGDSKFSVSRLTLPKICPGSRGCCAVRCMA